MKITLIDKVLWLVKIFKPFEKRQILNSTKLKKFADDIFKYDENGRKFSKRVENTVEKGEIVTKFHDNGRFDDDGRKFSKRVENTVKLLVTCNFSFLHIFFKRLVLQTHKNQGLFRKE